MDSMDELRSPSRPTSPAASIIIFPLPSTLFVLQLLGTIRCPEKPREAHPLSILTETSSSGITVVIEPPLCSKIPSACEGTPRGSREAQQLGHDGRRHGPSPDREADLP